MVAGTLPLILKVCLSVSQTCRVLTDLASMKVRLGNVHWLISVRGSRSDN